MGTLVALRGHGEGHPAAARRGARPHHQGVRNLSQELRHFKQYHEDAMTKQGLMSPAPASLFLGHATPPP